MTQSLFDTLEDTDSDWCASLCQMMAGDSKPKKSNPLEDEVAKLQAQIEKYKALEQAVVLIQKHVPPPAPKAAAKSKGKKGGAMKEEEEEKPPMREKGGKGKGKAK
mmetsp:Transcript_62479/g.158129  ORF Transcript_62479/g.158129 Transcript_62479/m.158129 type:complete len:106 (+) Transcript_62479:3-320(+)